MGSDEKVVLAIADTHVLSKVALMGSHVEDSQSGLVYTQNKIQETIWGEWLRMLDRVAEIGGVDVVFHLGDTCEGPDRKSYGLSPVTPNLNLQVEEAVKYMKMIKFRSAKKRIAAVLGSPYHIGENISLDAEVMSRLTDAGYDTVIDGDVAVEVSGVRFHLKHAMPVSRSVWIYKATHIAKEMLLTELQSDVWGKFDIILRGHVHTFMGVDYTHSTGYVLPGWKGRDLFAKKRTYGNPHLGYMLFFCDNGRWSREKHIFELIGDHSIKSVRW